MSYCIMRTRKLKTDGNVAASLAHAWRARETPNAEQSRTPENQHFGAKSKDEAIAKYRKALPEKVRKNGVRCIEYLITASPDALQDPKAMSKYYNDALTWLRAKHGKNLFYSGLHLDETTPHLYAYAVPIDERGKLNARSFLGGRDKMTALQDDFYQAVGKPSGLERGVRGSRAKHQAVKRFYGLVAESARYTLPTIEVPKPPRLGALFDLEHWQKSVQANIHAAVAPAFEKAKARAVAGDVDRQQGQAARRLAAQKEAAARQLAADLAATRQALLTMPIDQIQAMRDEAERIRQTRGRGTSRGR